MEVFDGALMMRMWNRGKQSSVQKTKGPSKSLIFLYVECFSWLESSTFSFQLSIMTDSRDIRILVCEMKHEYWQHGRKYCIFKTLLFHRYETTFFLKNVKVIIIAQ